MAIVIPERWKEKLKTENETEVSYFNKIEECIKRLNKIFQDNRPEFFKEYTNHGEMHINHVLENANKLITDENLEKMSKTTSEKTLVITIMGILFHDISMFINYEAFKKLITGNIYTKNVDKKSIKELWNDYCNEIQSYSDAELANKFGTNKINFKGLPDDGTPPTDVYDEMVIGEFIRRNHHKISQYLIEKQISIDGLKFNNDNTLIPDGYFTKNDLYCIGMIARSHGEEIRDLEGCFNRLSGNESPNKCDIFYSMALLSLADIIDAGGERALPIIKSLCVNHSDISLTEYEWNECFKYDDYSWDTDKHELIIDAELDAFSNAVQYNKMKNWIENTQKMLDKCLSIVSEKYGYGYYIFPIYRVKSNIFNTEYKEELSEKFYPEEVRFEANPDITKLLIAPLYGDNPTFGVRELVQNAVDACRERKAIGNDENYFGNVEVKVDTEKKLFTITDDGIGMTVETIKNYFLKAGASLRNSDYWQKQFIDENGKSEVCRNGQFGIGVLATFLIGDKATVTTRNINDNYGGWKFTFEHNQINIELQRDITADFGTKIEIPLTDTVINQLKDNDKENYIITHKTFWYNWYVWEEGEPVVKYWLDNIERLAKIPDVYWHKVQQNDFEELYWCYGKYINYSIYNGIKIFDSVNTIIQYRQRFSDIYIKCKEKSSKTNHLNLNIERTKINSISCKNELRNNLIKQYIVNDILLRKSILKLNGKDIIYCPLLLEYLNYNFVYTLYDCENNIISEDISEDIVYATTKLDDTFSFLRRFVRKDKPDLLERIQSEYKYKYSDLYTKSLSKYIVIPEFQINDDIQEPPFILDGCDVIEYKFVENHFYGEAEKTAFELMDKYFPKDTILKYGFPNDIKERVKIYENAYKELFRYLEEDIINGYRHYYFSYSEIKNAMRELNLLPSSDQSSDT